MFEMRKEIFKKLLDELVQKYKSEYRDSDPVGVVHELRGRKNIEIGGLFASALALGRAEMICRKAREFFDRMDSRPFEVIRESSKKEISKRLKNFKHRFFTSEDFIVLAWRLHEILNSNTSLGSIWKKNLPFEKALILFCGELNGNNPSRKKNSLISSPRDGSPCKRMLMYLRWMVRPDDGIDFGFWKFISPADLVIPLDTHVFRIAGLLGLTAGKAASWRTAVEITEKLKTFSPADPVRYDFALSRIGIVEGCKGKRSKVCDDCMLKSVCMVSGRNL